MAILLAFFFSLDSLFASFAIGTFRIEPERQAKLVFAFGICDGTASFIRDALGPSIQSLDWASSRPFHIAIAIYLTGVLSICFFETKWFHSQLLWTVPLALSLDNLAAPGVGLSMSVALVALVSASMSLVGFGLAALLGSVDSKAVSSPACNRRAMS